MSIFNLYTNPKNPGSFSGLAGFLKNNKKIKAHNALEVLRGEEAFTLHRPVRKKFPRNKHIANTIDETWHLDLCDMRNLRNKKLKQYNAYLLVCVDVLSKYAWVEPMQTKEAKVCAEAFKNILQRADPRKPKFVYMDRGREFMGEFTRYCSKHDIEQLFTNSIHKASVAERFNRTIKEKMFRYFTYSKEKNYIKILQDLVNSYNNSYHRSIKTTPSNVNKNNERKVYQTLYGDWEPHKIVFSIGDYVRIAIQKELFEKGYTANWSEQIYIINSIEIDPPPTRYTIKTLEGVDSNNKYYREELQKVNREEFPYDTFEVIDKKNNYLLIRQLNVEEVVERWVHKDQFTEKLESISNIQPDE